MTRQGVRPPSAKCSFLSTLSPANIHHSLATGLGLRVYDPHRPTRVTYCGQNHLAHSRQGPAQTPFERTSTHPLTPRLIHIYVEARYPRASYILLSEPQRSRLHTTSWTLAVPLDPRRQRPFTLHVNSTLPLVTFAGLSTLTSCLDTSIPTKFILWGRNDSPMYNERYQY